MRVENPVQIQIIKKSNEETVFKASLPVESVINSPNNFDQLLSNIEKEYTEVIRECRILLKKAKLTRRVNPLVYWSIGDLILKFINNLKNNSFFLSSQYAFFARDLGLSKTSIRNIIHFRKRFPRKKLIDPAIPWTFYLSGKNKTLRRKL